MILFVMRGLPGSGKSTKAMEIAQKHGAIICSADHFFTDGKGNYNFDPSKIGEAHAACKAKARNGMDRGLPVVIDNTNTQRWEWREYEKMAREKGYEVEIVEVGTRSESDLQEYFRRGLHGVPLAALRKMAARWED